MTVEADTPTVVFVAKPSHVTYTDGLQYLRKLAEARGLAVIEIAISAGGHVGFEISLSSDCDPTTFEGLDWSAA